MRLAEESAALNKQVAQKQMEASDYYMGVSKDSVAQAKKSWEFQDRYMDMARDYADGKTGDMEAGRANADVEQAYTGAMGSIARNAGRLGINPGSGAFAGAMGDLYTEKMLAGAGAQTNARLSARNKAEQMVGIAAGAGTAGFGTGLSAGGLATGANAGAVGAGAQSNTTLNGVNAGFNSGLNGASAGFGNSVGSWNSAVGTGSQHPWADAVAGLGNSALRAYGSYQTGGWNTGGNGTAGYDTTWTDNSVTSGGNTYLERTP
jgi:hypothetical protein